MSRYRLTFEAEQDLNLIKVHLLEEGGTRLVRHVLGRVQQALVLLSDNPEIGHLRTDLTVAPIKFWKVFSYLIVYDPTSRPLAIIRILHSSRDLNTLLPQ